MRRKTGASSRRKAARRGSEVPLHRLTHGIARAAEAPVLLLQHGDHRYCDADRHEHQTDRPEHSSNRVQPEHAVDRREQAVRARPTLPRAGTLLRQVPDAKRYAISRRARRTAPAGKQPRQPSLRRCAGPALCACAAAPPYHHSLTRPPVRPPVCPLAGSQTS